ncbi:lytic transglycosylase domain-containing protein [Pimelobacter simplex]|uniref:lytic transglycosylase domain-containing protein n=1 Tax=Nocardioides simplex TaxID=2045 RepID=UPI001EB876D6|nr:lytic transglycosylase domain-containing protein [Pimelobacter simplex]
MTRRRPASRRAARRAAGLAALVVLPALSAACGGDPGERRPGADATATPSPTTTSPPTPGTAPTSDPAPAAPALGAPAPAGDADELARRLVAAEDVVRDPAATEDALRQAAFDTQVLYRQLARRPAWHDRVLAAAGPYRATVTDHLEARRGLRSVLTRLSGELPAWRIVRPAPLDDLRTHYAEGERAFGVPWEVLAAVNLVETGFGRIRGLSTAGARGPMQFIPSTWARYGKGDIDDPRDAVLAAARYLAASGGTTPGGLDDALHSYNHHDGYVSGVRAYARVLERDPGALAGLYRWQIVYLSQRGDVWLPEGYRRRAPLPVERYVERHPERLLGTATD